MKEQMIIEVGDACGGAVAIVMLGGSNSKSSRQCLVKKQERATISDEGIGKHCRVIGKVCRDEHGKCSEGNNWTSSR